MRLKLSIILLLSGIAAGSTAANAEDKASGLSIGVTAGTLGIGPELGYRISPLFGVRGNATFFGIGHDFDVSDITYNGHLKLSTFGVNADLYPFQGGLRISAGARINKNKIRMSATPTTPVSVGDGSYTPGQIRTLSGHVKTKDFAPTLTVGYAGGLTKGIKFGIDAGAMFQGNPRINDLKATGSFATDPLFVANLAKEQRKIDDKIDKYSVYPVLQFSLSYAF